MNYYNEFDPFAGAWLRNLIQEGCIPGGTVDARSITEVRAEDLLGYNQCHFFSGIGGWSEALRLAGCRAFTGIWTASLPCQPLSSAGRQRGSQDKRHLWPEFYSLVSECKPAVIVGEQAASRLGREWLDGISLDLEELGYAVAASDLCAASVGAPHIRQRLYWGACRLDHAASPRLERHEEKREVGTRRWDQTVRQSAGSSANVRVANAEYSPGCSEHVSEPRRRTTQAADTSVSRGTGRVADTADDLRGSRECGAKTGVGARSERRGQPAGGGPLCGLGNTSSLYERRSVEREPIGKEGIEVGRSGSGLDDSIVQGLEGQSGNVHHGDESGWINSGTTGPIAASDLWSDWYLVECRDGKKRRVGTGVRPLAYGIPRDLGRRKPGLRKFHRSAGRNRVGRLKGYGNAIVPQLAAVFVAAFLDSIAEIEPRFSADLSYMSCQEGDS